MVAVTQDLFEPTANPPYNRQYHNQGWQNNQPICGNPPPQQQGQQRQPYTYSQPQNNQNDTTSSPAQVSPPAANTLPAQPSQNLKIGINALQHEKKKKGRHVGDEERRSYSLYDLIAQLANSDDEESEVDSERGYSDESGEDRVGVELYEAQEREKESGDSQSEEESDVEDEIEEVETDDEADKTFFIATLFNNKRVKEEIPAKCEDPGPSLVTCKIKHAVVRECLCDPGAYSSVMPYELYKFLGLGPLKKTEEIFTNADASVV
ncbi:hypothetical protein PIB30_014080 [Stylosanthes scabra]|uniref:Uncharacterized protein n=1 Tax=Stylosanthes scabra TaxID=79078 RepID=A0ABU6R5K0_9FABA|nr:hypothetical protein [Stylosanthes scabra]